MRILTVHGINQVANIYRANLTKNGHSVAIYEPNLIGGHAPLWLKLALMPYRFFDMRRVIGKLNPNHFDIAHIHWATYGVLGLVSRIPYIVECHGDDLRYRLQHPFFRPILTRILRRAAGVHCITPDLLPVAQLVRPDATFFPGPVDTNRFSPAEEHIPSSAERPWTILLFTRLDPNKGPGIAINGIARFVERHQNVRVLLLDWGLLKEQYKRTLGAPFEFIPCVPPGEVHHLIRSADVVVGQFFFGILSFCELQAMSCGKPVICSFRYYHAYPTFPPLCEASSPQEIDDHLEDLFQNPEKGRELGRKARAWVIANHDSQMLSRKLEKLYSSIVKHA